MSENNQDAKTEESQASAESSTVEKEQATNVSEDANTQEAVTGKSFQEKYEDSKKAIKAAREAKRAEKARADKLESKLARMETQTPQQGNEVAYTATDAKVDVLFEMENDPFVRENKDDLIDIMSEKNLTLKDAADHLRAKLFKDMYNSATPAEVNKPFNQQKPTATAEPVQQVRRDSKKTLDDALAGKMDIDPRQLEAIRRVMPKNR